MSDEFPENSMHYGKLRTMSGRRDIVLPDQPAFSPQNSAENFLKECGLDPTPDAVGQLAEVFLPCLRIVCERGYDPNGGTWRPAGRLGMLTEVRKKFDRLWDRAWKNGKNHDDSAIDLINVLGFYLRADRERFGDWGEPGGKDA